MVLDEILAHKRSEIAARKTANSLESLQARAVPTSRSLAQALRAGRPGFLLEIKFASPSAGIIRAGSDLTPVVASYGRHAAAVSARTDQRFFAASPGAAIAWSSRSSQGISSWSRTRWWKPGATPPLPSC